MEYSNNKIRDIMRQLGIHKVYKGCRYIISSINFIAENECYDPVTKVLYIEVAKQYHTSALCVERNIRSVIEMIWEQRNDEKLMCEIFGEHFLQRRPSNLEFLILLYEYVKLDIERNVTENINNLICPLSGKVCAFYAEYIAK